MSYKHGKAKHLHWNGYGTRKSWNNLKNNTILPRSDGEFWYQTDKNRSKRRKWLEKQSNKKGRKEVIGSGNEYRKHYNLRQELD